MTEFKLNNGQPIELTRDGILIKGNYISIDGNMTILKDDKYATIMEQDNKQVKNSYVPIDDEPKIMEPNQISNERLAALETRLSTAMTEIHNLKITIKEGETSFLYY